MRWRVGTHAPPPYGRDDVIATLTLTLPALAAGVPWLVIGALLFALCRAAAAGERRRLSERADPAEPVPATPPPRTPHELVACALVSLDVEHATLFAAEGRDGMRILARGHLDVRADVESPEVHVEAAAAALDASACLEFGGASPAPLVAAAPVVRRGRTVGALAVSSWSVQRGRLTFAQRRIIGDLGAAAAALPELEPLRVPLS